MTLSPEPYRLDRQSARGRCEARPAHATTRSRRRIEPPMHERKEPKQPEPQHVSGVYAGCVGAYAVAAVLRELGCNSRLGRGGPPRR